MELVGMVLIVAATGGLILWPLLRRTDSASAEIAIAPAGPGRGTPGGPARGRDRRGAGQEPLCVLRREPAAGGPFLPLLRRAGGCGGGTMTRAAVAAAVTVAFLLLATGAFGAPAPQGAISGAVQNLTGGKAKAGGGQTVTLTIYVNNAEVDKKTATTDARGAFTFAVPADPARTYLVNVKYKGGDYDSPQVTFKVGESAQHGTMRVYEPTTAASVLRVNVQHMIVEPGEGLVQITELLVFANPTDRTYVGAKVREDGKREALQFRLPDGAANAP